MSKSMTCLLGSRLLGGDKALNPGGGGLIGNPQAPYFTFVGSSGDLGEAAVGGAGGDFIGRSMFTIPTAFDVVSTATLGALEVVSG